MMLQDQPYEAVKDLPAAPIDPSGVVAVGEAASRNQNGNTVIPSKVMRGRVYTQNDVLTGVSGIEHLSNAIKLRNKPNQPISPAAVGALRSSPYAHRGSQPESTL